MTEFGFEEEVPTTRNDSSKETISVDSLKGRVCYFSLAGNLALSAFDEIECSKHPKEDRKQLLKDKVLRRLYFAVIMFDIVVMHCSDPLRSEIILEILEEHVDWVKKGKILFIFSDKISNVRQDYRRYIQKKKEDYLHRGYCTKKEADSLSCSFMTDEYYERVISLLEPTPYLVRKPEDDEYSFGELVLNDLNNGDRIFVDANADLSQILTLDLSLYQLLNIRIMSVDNFASDCKTEYAFNLSVVDTMINEVQDHLRQGSVIARSAIVDSLISTTPRDYVKHQQKKILAAITLRMDVLYCRMNSGRQLILEFHPYYEHRSIYQTECFFEFLSCVSKNKRKIRVLDSEVVDRIANDNNIEYFRLLYLACMADAKEHMSLGLRKTNDNRRYQKEFLRCFRSIFEEQYGRADDMNLNSIRKLLRGEK